MNQRGQEFSAFRLLIDAILVLLILVIIIGIIGWVNSLRTKISEKRLFEGFGKAVNSPDGKTVLEKNIVLTKGSTYLAGAFAHSSPGVKKECIRLDAANLIAIRVVEHRQVDIVDDVQVDMYYRCIRNISGECSPGCDLCCWVSFGKEFEEQD